MDQPTDALYLADDRQMANEVLELSFEYARAQARLLSQSSPAPAAPAAPGPSQAPASASPSAAQDYAQKTAAAEATAEAAIKTLQQNLDSLQDQLKTAKADTRGSLLSQIAAVRGQLDLARARVDALKGLVEFETANGQPGKASNPLGAQIDELEKTVPEAERTPKPAPGAAIPGGHHAQPTGIFGLAEGIFTLNRKLSAIRQAEDLTAALSNAVEKQREPLIKQFADINQRANELAQASTSSTDAAALRQRQKDFQALIERHKLAVSATVPLTKAMLVMHLYAKNLERWYAATERRSTAEFRTLMVRLIVLAVVLAVVFGAAILWRHFTFRYVQDVRRRHQLLQARRIVLAIVIALILLFNFANELGAIATVMGLAAAGVAFALQNVILSFAGYFFLIGKFGIKVGDRVQIGGVTGDIIDIGLVKLSLIEVNGSETDRQPTGRVVVFSNSVVFQPSGNFSKQIPGTNFVWNQVSFKLSSDCDYRLAEKRLLDAVNAVYARYRDSIERQHRAMERSLNLVVEMPHPHSRLHLDQSGLQVVIRYPVEIRNAAQTSDEISRLVLDTIRREPTLKLVEQATPNIQAVAPPSPDDGTAAGKP